MTSTIKRRQVSAAGRRRRCKNEWHQESEKRRQESLTRSDMQRDDRGEVGRAAVSRTCNVLASTKETRQRRCRGKGWRVAGGRRGHCTQLDSLDRNPRASHFCLKLLGTKIRTTSMTTFLYKRGQQRIYCTKHVYLLRIFCPPPGTWARALVLDDTLCCAELFHGTTHSGNNKRRNAHPLVGIPILCWTRGQHLNRLPASLKIR